MNTFKKILFIQLIAIISCSVYAQIPISMTGIVEKKITTNIAKVKLLPGTEIQFVNYKNDVSNNSGRVFFIRVDDKSYHIDENDLKKININEQATLDAVWSKVLVTDTDVYKNFLKDGMHMDIRHDADEDCIDFISEYSKYNLFFDDIYLEEYLQNLIPLIHPITLYDKRPGNLSIKVVIDNTPDAFVLPNGTIMLSTGMLSLIDSEEELIAILAHEVSHFVLDHYVDNIIKAEQRKKRAEFWAGFATALAAASDVYLASQDPNYQPGILTASTAVIAYTVANIAIERLGLKYSREQEEQADKVAKQILLHLNISPNALATVFDKLKDYSISIGDYAAFSSNGTHPALQDRIAYIGTPQIDRFISNAYYLTISNASTITAIIEFYQHHFKVADRIITRNINAGIGVEEDYILKARLFRNLYRNKDKMHQALDFLKTAESLAVVPQIDLYRDMGLTYIRLEDFEQAKSSFVKYLEDLNKIDSKSVKLNDEKDWTKKMIYKCDKLI